MKTRTTAENKKQHKNGLRILSPWSVAHRTQSGKCSVCHRPRKGNTKKPQKKLLLYFKLISGRVS